MRLTAYAFLIFFLSATFYLMGFTSPLMDMYNQQQGQPISIPDLLSKMITAILTEEGLIQLGVVATAAVVVTLLTGFGAIYIFPILFLLVVLNYIIFPLSFVFDASMPDILKILLVAFFNMLTVLFIMNFVRGQS